MKRLRILGLPYSVYTRSVLLVCEEKSIPYELEQVDVFHAGTAAGGYQKLNPFARIPTLIDDTFCLYETTAITHYLDDAYPGPALQPQRAAHRARMNQLISILDSYVYRTCVWDVFVERVGKPEEGQATDEARIAQALPLAEKCLMALAQTLPDGLFLAGERLTLADLHAWPMLKIFSLAKEGETLLAASPLADWLRRVEQRASVSATVSIYG